MTLYTDRKPREAVARVLAETYHGKPADDAYVFGAATGGKVFVDQATAALNTLRELGFITSEGLDAIHAEEDANGEPRSSVVPGAPK